VAGVGTRNAASAELRKRLVADPLGRQTRRERRAAEVRPAAGGGVAPHVEDALDPVRAEDSEESLERLVGVPDREKELRVESQGLRVKSEESRLEVRSYGLGT
jgi:hypothetical protein